MATATSITMDEAVRWARPAVAMLVATVAATLGVEQTIRCPDCGASWVGYTDDPCDWCTAAIERQLADQRQRILYPDWMTEQGPVYDQLDDVDKMVWDATRGIQRGEASVTAWARRLVDAVDAGIVTDVEARLAWERAAR
jgi:hypothetical protein